ncbi:MAG: DUF1839 family protein [Methylobacteriaceae bacterium]|nr:DUF1839 family protein [Methylobacteriaceae bacterium]
MQAIAGLEARVYAPHPLHGASRDWAETNCSVDLMIELVASLGRAPEAALGVTAALDFEGDQFTFFKLASEDLRDLCGIEIQELSLYDDLLGHMETQIARGRVVLVEVDAWRLPDTAGVSYRLEHSKTTIGVNRLDRAARSIGYFHNAGYFDLEGEDFDGLFPSARDGLPLFPYCEIARIGAPPSGDVAALAARRLAGHVSRAPRDNPFAEFAARLDQDAAALAGRAPAAFHKYAFNTLRQAGANFELLAAHLDWLAQNGQGDFSAAREGALAIAARAKALQFQLARAVTRRRTQGLAAQVEPLEQAWTRAIGALRREIAP